ncbi:hypothetical protein M6D81_25780 [Paenibacillus sp. J5C_2022]|uniref:hypothetical protein n=1 Tax=Paenibacillus sp. J5C2022 TaxID=2977129 RepID=UPI0021CFDEFC|nr:hypothetical protein [Paenibacillus sp. J5C2022]MCU6712114.1 hypothetical protein [Paenibacillus sp. J5C2022]
MNEKELIARIGRIGPTETQKERMLRSILAPEAPKKAPLKAAYRLAIPAACCAMLALVLTIPLFFKQEAAIPQLVPASAQPAVGVSVFGVPTRGLDRMGPQKYMNYNGHRYTFLQQGAAYDLSGFMPESKEELGSLQFDVLEDLGNGGKKGYADKDYAATFLVGGTLYSLPGYDTGFRLAVELDGQYYIAQLAGRTDDRIIPADEYIALADLKRLAERVDIMDHSGSKLLHSLEEKRAVREWIEAISASSSADDLTSEDYERLAGAQSEGQSYMIKYHLKDNTTIDMYVVPELKLASIGNGRYVLDDAFLKQYGQLFINN